MVEKHSHNQFTLTNFYTLVDIPVFSVIYSQVVPFSLDFRYISIMMLCFCYILLIPTVICDVLYCLSLFSDATQTELLSAAGVCLTSVDHTQALSR